MSALLTYTLRQGDRSLILSQRLLEYVTHGPELEEEMAIANIALDLLGQARLLYTRAGEVEGLGHDEDHFAYWRDHTEFLNPLLVEQPQPDFAHLIVRQFLHDAFTAPYWELLADSSDEGLAGIGAKAAKETAYHLRHSRSWVVRLGDGTDESHRRMQEGLDAIWRFTGEMFLDDDVDRAAAEAGYGVLPSTLRDAWQATVTDAITEATLVVPDDPSVRTGGRTGRHSEEMGPLLAEMQYMYRSFPGASW